MVESEWLKKPALSTERFHAAASFNNLGQWMVSGGEDNHGNILHSTEVMHSDGRWGSGLDMIGDERSGHCQVTTYLGILVIGGFKFYQVLDSVILLAPNTATWVAATSMKHRRQTMTCALSEDEVWVMGGFNYFSRSLASTLRSKLGPRLGL